MAESKTYIIDTWEKLLNTVNADNLENLTIDLSMFLRVYAISIDGVRKSNPKEAEGKLNTEIAGCSFEWTDDGLHEMRTAKIINPSTGEVTDLKTK